MPTARTLRAMSYIKNNMPPCAKGNMNEQREPNTLLGVTRHGSKPCGSNIGAFTAFHMGRDITASHELNNEDVPLVHNMSNCAGQQSWTSITNATLIMTHSASTVRTNCDANCHSHEKTATKKMATSEHGTSAGGMAAKATVAISACALTAARWKWSQARKASNAHVDDGEW